MMVSRRASTKTDSAAPAIWTSPPSGLLQRKCACGGSPGVDGECAECRQKRLVPQPSSVQRKLTINQPGDRYEREADRIADRVMRMADPIVAGSPAGDCVAPNKARSDNHADLALRTGRAADVPPAVRAYVASLPTTGQPLNSEMRAFMESRFGHDFSCVRVHTDTRAAASARAVTAQAYTVGRHVVFGAGQYIPYTSDGQHLLAHELTHVLQQGAERSPRVSRTAHETLQRQEPTTTAAAGVTIGAIAAKCIIGAIIGALFDVAIQTVLQSIRQRTWRFWRVTLDYCSIILSAILGCIAAPIAAFALDGWITARLGSRLGGVAGTLIGKILLFIAKKIAISVPKGLVGKLAKLGCISPEQASELGVGGPEETEA